MICFLSLLLYSLFPPSHACAVCRAHGRIRSLYLRISAQLDALETQVCSPPPVLSPLCKKMREKHKTTPPWARQWERVERAVQVKYSQAMENMRVAQTLSARRRSAGSLGSGRSSNGGRRSRPGTPLVRQAGGGSSSTGKKVGGEKGEAKYVGGS